jgi:hypothetical protein
LVQRPHVFINQRTCAFLYQAEYAVVLATWLLSSGHSGPEEKADMHTMVAHSKALPAGTDTDLYFASYTFAWLALTGPALTQWV